MLMPLRENRDGLATPMPYAAAGVLASNSTRFLHRSGIGFAHPVRCRGRPCTIIPPAFLQRYGIGYAHPVRCRGRPCTIKQKRCAQASLVHLFCFMVRKEWDSNPRYTKKRTPDFESGPFDHSGIFPLQK